MGDVSSFSVDLLPRHWVTSLFLPTGSSSRTGAGVASLSKVWSLSFLFMFCYMQMSPVYTNLLVFCSMASEFCVML